MPHDVFVSHSAKNKVAADAVEAALERSGVRCWVAPRDVLLGRAWAEEILRGLQGSRLMILLFSSHANTSEQILREVERAVHQGLPLLPVRIEDVLPSGAMEYFLSASHWMDAMTPPFERHVSELVEKVRLLLHVEQIPTEPSVIAAQASPPAPSRRLSIPWLAFVAIALLIGAGVWLAAGEWRTIQSRLAVGPAPSSTPAPLSTPTAEPAPGQALQAKLPTPGQSVVPLTADYGPRIITNSIGMKFVEIKPGSFMMGSPPTEEDHQTDETLHKVTLTHGFFMAQTHVTVAQLRAFVNGSGYQTDAEKEGWAYAFTGEKFDKVDGASWRKPGFEQGDDHPAVEVSWNDAVALCKWLNGKESGHTYRLPTEAEYEYCCRAGATTAFPWGDNPDDGQGWANCADSTFMQKFPSLAAFNWNDGYVFTSPVGKYKSNAFGLYDMIGNAWEWCSDWYGDHPQDQVTDPTGPANGTARVLRGGSWYYIPLLCRCAYRGNQAPAIRDVNFGFRLVLDFP